MGDSQVQTELLLGVEGGGTRCRAPLAEPSDAILGEGSAGPLVAREGDAPEPLSEEETERALSHSHGLNAVARMERSEIRDSPTRIPLRSMRATAYLEDA